jgi:hypothetical protein
MKKIKKFEKGFFTKRIKLERSSLSVYGKGQEEKVVGGKGVG